MNIFYLDKDITKCAQAHADMHVNKMILESAQLLASVHHMTGTGDRVDYRLTHKNHPCAIWARTSFSNYIYLIDLMEALNLEANYRFNHTKVHLSLQKVMQWPCPNITDIGFTEPPKCVHDDFKSESDVVQAYREYYRRDKQANPLFGYTKRTKPDWL